MRKLTITVLLCILCSLNLLSQTTTISGKITDEKGAALEGASILVKGSRQGTVSSATGAFSIHVKDGGKLVISALGYETKEVAASENMVVQMASSVQSLSEVVVTGLGVATSRKKTAISVESVTSDKLPAAPTGSIDQALVGKIPGAQISSIDGTPGAKINILLRGINTIQRGTMPIILVDGVQVGATDINSLDLSNIERVEVIQGAASATIYGAQGANGVIQLFTKKGKQGKINIDFSSSYSDNAYINSGNVHKARLHSFRTDSENNVVDGSGNIIKVEDDGTYAGIAWAYPAGNGNPTAMSNPLNIVNKKYDHNLQYYDHFKQLFKNGYSINNNLNVSGANNKMDFALTLSNNRQESNIRNNGYVDRTNFTANVGTQLFNGFTLRSITQLVYTKNTLHPFYGEGRNNIYNMLNTSPFFDLEHKLADGTYPFSLNAGTISVNGYNPNYDFEYTSGEDNKVDVVQNLQANYKVNKFVELDGKYGINYKKQDIKWIFQNQSGNLNSNSQESWQYQYNSNDNTGEIDNFSYTTTFQNLLLSAYIKTDFQKDFNSRLPITTSTQISYDYRKNMYKQYITYGVGLPSYPIYNLNQTSSQAVVGRLSDGTQGDYVEPFVTYGYLINQKIDFGDFGGISGGFRSDYSSAFGKGSTPFTFPRADGYIRPSSFDFWKNSKIANVLPEVKLRAAYGEAGIQPLPFDRYPTLNTGNIGSSLYFSLPTSQKNPNLQVEVSKEFEAGTDIAINGARNGDWFKNFNFSFTYWTRKGENVIYPVSIAPSTGGSTLQNNSIFLSSHGVQASLNMEVLHTRDLTWNFTTNFGKQTSKIDRINGPDIILTTNAGSTSLVLKAGDKIGQIYGYKAFRSFDQKKQDGTPYIDKADYGKYQLVNGYLVDTATKGVQFTNEAYAFGDPNPKFNASFINSFSYKDYLLFSFQFDWVNGSHLYNQTKEWMYRDGISGDYDNAVTINGQTAAYTAYYRSVYADYFGARNGPARNGTKDYFYEDASFLRLRNISIGLDFAKLFSIKNVRRLQLVLTGRNILTVTKYSGFDPEVSSGTTNSAFDRGIDHSSMPNVRSYQVGLNLGF
ncbi:SusC/RagA family TonB-linked outer membrane protein [Danxiaibacter flavus]|uniref:SusC/RagA family TonB-linked outer membrane protein n=1 Tax=Danxiaibacter flavus TaxID=3049108 RepID=A0ABV3ZJE5_9BACT|nr:SusC/RagA family TonB-linked outer membrane protein [Chitinophagaceae bacterium DXS]